MTTVSETLVEFPIEPKDQQGNHISHHHLQVQVKGPQSVSAHIKEKNGKPHVSFTTTITGDYTVSIQHNGQHIQNSPVTVNVKPKQPGDAAPNPILPPPVAQQTHGQKHPVRFEVDAKDHEGKDISNTQLEINISGPEEVRGCDVQLNHGKFLFTFETSCLGDFTVHVKHHGHDIQRSPFTLTVAPHSGQGPVKDVARLD